VRKAGCDGYDVTRYLIESLESITESIIRGNYQTQDSLNKRSGPSSTLKDDLPYTSTRPSVFSSPENDHPKSS
jgi:hypothetical protein